MILPLPADPPQANTVTFTGGRWLTIAGVTAAQHLALVSLLTMVNPRRAARARYTGWHDDDEPKELVAYQSLGDTEIAIAPGAGAVAWKTLTGLGARCVFAPGLQKPAPLPPQLTYIGEAREYQDPVVASMLAHPHAVAVGPCGCGKTDMAIRVMCDRSCPWLIVVHMRKLRTQWAERLIARVAAMLPVPAGANAAEKVSLYRTTGKQRWNPAAAFVIATVQALSERPDDVVALAGESRGIWVDECHHTPCRTFTKVIALGDWRYRYGVTATPDRSDGTTALMHWWIGPEVARVNRDHVEASGHLLRPTLRAITTAFTATYNPDEPGDQQRLIGALCEDTDRAALVADTMAALYREGRHILVCVDRIAYGELLANYLHARNVEAEVCHAKKPNAEQDAIMAAVDAGDLRVVIATSLADEALDLPILDTTVLATPSGSATRTEQRMGRACRPLAGKLEPLVIDFVDHLVQREEVKTDPETGQTTIKTHRIFVNQFRTRYNRVYRDMCHCDTDAIKRVLKAKGDARDRSSRTPAA